MNKRINIILCSYFIFPLVIIFLVINFFMGWEVNNHIPKVPEYWPFFNFVFNTPHVVASSLLILGKDSWREYRFKFSGAIILFSVITYLFFYKLRWEYFLPIYSVLTLKHVIIQQFNLSHMFGLKRDWISFLWKGLGFISALIIYWKVYSPNEWEIVYIHEALIICISIFTIISIMAYMRSVETNSKRVILANSAMVVLSYLAFVMNGEFFSVLCIRAVHDITGFVHYVDVFKSRRVRNESAVWYDFLYKCTKSDWVTTLAAPISVVALILIFIPQGSERMSFLMVLSLLHYYTESFTWKSGEIYRKYL